MRNNQSEFGCLENLDYLDFDCSLYEQDQKLQKLQRRKSFEQSSNSIENTILFSHSMSSSSGNVDQLQERQYQQKQRQKITDLIPQQLRNIFDFSAVDGFDLNKLVYIGSSQSKMKDQNKNVLRNFGNAQKHYTLYHKKARQHILRSLDDPSQFDNWVRSLKLQKFQDFKRVWRQSKNKLFARLYRQICWQFYTQNAIPFVSFSRIKKIQTKMAHLQQISCFLKGISHPNQFTSFKKTW